MNKIVKFTQREKEVLTLIAEGRNNSEIAEFLGISIHTVKAHIGNIFSKLNVHNKVQAAAYAIKNNLV